MEYRVAVTRLARASCTALLALGCNIAAAQYNITGLPSPYGVYDEAYAISNTGQVAGFTYLPGFTASHATQYASGTTKDLGTLGGAWSLARGINDAGYVVGWSATADDAQRAFVYDGITMRDLGTLGGTNSFAYAINNSGQIVGSTFDATNTNDRAFLYSGGVMQDIGSLGGSTVATDINNSGRIAGVSNATPNSGPSFHAFSWSGGVMTDLGTLGGANSFANAINEGGDVVGSSQFDDGFNQHAFLYSAGAMHDLGTLGGDYSLAFDVNNSGQVVGMSFNSAGNGRAFVYANGVMRDLNSLIDPNLGFTVDLAYGINDQGQIVGRAFDGSGFRAVLLDPVAAVPEPETYGMLLAGLALIGYCARRRISASTG